MCLGNRPGLQYDKQAENPYTTVIISYFCVPMGVLTTAQSPGFLPRSALPNGESTEILFFLGSASVEPTTS